jgi:hypothetical protein
MFNKIKEKKEMLEQKQMEERTEFICNYGCDMKLEGEIQAIRSILISLRSDARGDKKLLDLVNRFDSELESYYDELIWKLSEQRVEFVKDGSVN